MITNHYGAINVSSVDASQIDHSSYHDGGLVDWSDNRLARIVRLRLLSDPGHPAWDVSYCYGELKDGTRVRVELPFSDLPKSRSMKREWAAMIAHGKRDGVYVKGLIDQGAISTLC